MVAVPARRDLESPAWGSAYSNPFLIDIPTIGRVSGEEGHDLLTLTISRGGGTKG